MRTYYWHDDDDDSTSVTLPQHLASRRFLQSGRKKALFIAIALAILLLISQIFCFMRVNKPSLLPFSTLHHEEVENLRYEAAYPVPCIKNYLGSAKSMAKLPGTCQHLVPPRGFCSLIQDLFFEKHPETCSREAEVTFCKQVEGNINCSMPEVCKELSLLLGSFDSKEGETVWKETHFRNLESEVLNIIAQPDYKGYVFIKCLNDSQHTDFSSYETGNSKNNGEYIQLFLHPPAVRAPNTKHDKKLHTRPNLNFIMVDSVSRDHLFRSLPKTISVLEQLKEARSSNPIVLDFEYVQAIKQRTYESLEALFAGYVDTEKKSFGTYDMPDKPLPLNVLLSKLKERNYSTLWLEDLCWTWEWGLSKDLKVTNKSLSKKDLWESYQNALNFAQIDSVDVTVASCDILKANDRNDPFHDTSAVCFNGLYHHEYLLDYLRLYQEAHRQEDRNIFTFTMLSVAHDETGFRIQSLDQYLQRYVKFASTLDNTLTVLLSDHGNSYGEFLKRSPEAYIETFNPFLIFLIPAAVQKMIGDVGLGIMSDNQHRLISLIDVHETILALIGSSNEERDTSFVEKYVIAEGLLSYIPPKRTCNDIPVIMPNLCICKNFDVVVSASEMHYAMADFSVGALNNLILTQRLKSGRSGFRNCQLLVVKNVRRVREMRKSADIIRFKLDVQVSGILSAYQSELFFFTVEIRELYPSIQLISYERMSVYALFSQCQDVEVETKMCLCDQSNTEKSFSFLFPNFVFSAFRNSAHEVSKSQAMAFLKRYSSSMETKIDKKYPEVNPCAFILRHTYASSSFNVYAVNLCSSLITVTLKFISVNIHLSVDSVSSHFVHSLEVKHLVAGTKRGLMLDASWSYKIILRSL